MELNKTKYIFVAGIPRSGTTLVQNILDCHPDIYGGPEFDRVPNIIDLRRKLISSVANGRIDLYVTKKDVDHLIADFIRSLLAPVAHKHNCSFVSEKTPWNILVFEDLIEILPEAKYIFVMRNPYAVISSMINVAKSAKRRRKRSPDFTRKTTLACYYIESSLKLIDHLEKKYPNKIYTVKFEDLLEKPASEIKELCDYIEIDFNEKMLKPAVIEHPGQSHMIKEGTWYTTSTFKKHIDVKNIDKWETELDHISKAFLNHVFTNNTLINKYGYQLHYKTPTLFKIIGYIKYIFYSIKYNFSMIPIRILN